MKPIELTCNSFVRKFGYACKLGLDPLAPLALTYVKVAGIPKRLLGNVMKIRSL